jgi:hypothetical protein
MTIIHGIEIDDIEYKPNDIKTVLRSDRKPIEDKLHVIAVISNPCLFARRYILFKEFIQRMERDEPNVIVYVVEMAYVKQKFLMTQAKNPRHLQLRTETPIWHKENMINLGVHRLLPPDWKAFAWIDGDVEFDSPTWALDTLRILNGECDIVQVFSHCVDMDAKERPMSVFQSAGFQYSKKVPFGTGKNLWHPGYAWACTRDAYQIMGGLYDQAILGSGDNIMMLSLIQNGHKAINPDSTDGYRASVRDFQLWVKDLRFGYVPGVIRHFFHGHKHNRKYMDRWKILVDYNYDPHYFVHYTDEGILVPTPGIFPMGLKREIMKYFAERNEDEGLGKDGKYRDMIVYDSEYSVRVSNQEKPLTNHRRSHEQLLKIETHDQMEDAMLHPKEVEVLTESERNEIDKWTYSILCPNGPGSKSGSKLIGSVPVPLPGSGSVPIQSPYEFCAVPTEAVTTPETVVATKSAKKTRLSVLYKRFFG